jgi:hypothetical protein
VFLKGTTFLTIFPLMCGHGTNSAGGSLRMLCCARSLKSFLTMLLLSNMIVAQYIHRFALDRIAHNSLRTIIINVLQWASRIQTLALFKMYGACLSNDNFSCSK